MEVALGPWPGVTLCWKVAAAAHSEFPGDFLLVLFFICWFVSKSGLGELWGGEGWTLLGLGIFCLFGFFNYFFLKHFVVWVGFFFCC